MYGTSGERRDRGGTGGELIDMYSTGRDETGRDKILTGRYGTGLNF